MPRSALLLLLLVVTAAGCSRLTFIRSNPDKRVAEGRSSPSYEVQDSPEVTRRHSARNHLLLAQRELGRGNLDAAESEARAARDAAPESGDAYSMLALIAERRGRSAEAGELHRRAAEMSPRDGGSLNN